MSNIYIVQETIFNKILKYEDLSHEIKEIWHQEIVMVDLPIVVSSTGVLPKGNLGIATNLIINIHIQHNSFTTFESISTLLV